MSARNGECYTFTTGNNIFYCIGFRVLVSEKLILQEYFHPRRSTNVEWGCAPRGVFITHVVLTVNKTIQRGYSRARYSLPRCEFLHGPQVQLRLG